MIDIIFEDGGWSVWQNGELAGRFPTQAAAEDSLESFRELIEGGK